MTSVSLTNIQMPVSPLGGVNALPIFKWQQPYALQVPQEDSDDKVDSVGLQDAETVNYVDIGVSSMMPYQVQDRFDRKRQPTDVKSVLIENDHLAVRVLPHLGGRLYAIRDKKQDRDILFTNPVLQFCNLGLRNAWFSGGIEWNGSGIPGHTPATTEPVFCSQIDTEKGPVVRLYNFDRIGEIAWQVDLFLPDGDDRLFVHSKIVNPNADMHKVYWWTNIAAPYSDGMRVVTPTDYSVEHVLPDNHLERFDYPEKKEFEASYPENWRYATSVFLRKPDMKTLWIASCEKDGSGFGQIGTENLRGRKFFYFGDGPGGRNWMQFLSPGEGDGRYVEIQAGLMPTQNQLYSLAGQSSVEWTECFFALPDCKAAVEGPYADAVQLVGDMVAERVPERDLYDIEAFLEKVSVQPTGKMLLEAEEWGYLHELALGRPISPGMSFETPDTGSSWRKLVRGEDPGFSIDRNDGYQVSDTWKSLIEHDIQNGRATAMHHLHLGILMMDRGEMEMAETELKRSLEMERTWLGLRCLAVHSHRTGNAEDALRHYAEAVAQPNCSVDVKLEYATLLTQLGKWTVLSEVLAGLSDADRAIERFRLLDAKLALHDKDYARLETLLDYDFAQIREGEMTLTELWNGLVEGRLAEELGRAANASEIAEAHKRLPIPARLDFSMFSDTQE